MGSVICDWRENGVINLARSLVGELHARDGEDVSIL